MKTHHKTKVSLKIRILCIVLGVLFFTISSYTINYMSASNRIQLESKGFSIIPPKNWTVSKNSRGMSLLMMEPEQKHSLYRATIQVITSHSGMSMNDVNAKKIAKFISEEIPSRNNLMKGYRLRNYEPVNLNDGRKGYIYYSEFSIDNVNLMQMHLLISSATKHFLVTYTDLASYFDGDISTRDKLSTVWSSFSSIELDSKSPIPIYQNTTVLAIIIGIIAFMTLITLTRKLIFKNQIQKVMNSGAAYSSDLPTSSYTSGISNYGSNLKTNTTNNTDVQSEQSSIDDDFFSNAG